MASRISPAPRTLTGYVRFKGRRRALFSPASVGLTLLAPFFTFTLGFCAPPGGFGDLGTDTGGPQDIGFARSIILDGGIPDPDSVTVEGFLSEHEIPLTEPENAGTFYPYTTLAWRQPFGSTTGAATADLIVAIGTTIAPATFERQPQNLTVVIDRSGSMDETASGTDSRSKMEAVKDAMESLLDVLTPADQISIVTFNGGARVRLEPTSAGDEEAILDVIEDIEPQGSTDIGLGLDLGFSTCESGASSLRANRVLFFTDALPSSGNLDDDDFIETIQAYADLGIGFTLLAVGVDYGYELGYELSQVRDANSYFLENDDRIAQIFEQEFDYLVSPAAYDLVLDVTIPAGIGISQVYGVPDYVPGTDGARVVIPTLFFSSREGSGVIVVRLTFSAPPDTTVENLLANVDLSYTLVDGTLESGAFEFRLPAGVAAAGDPAFFLDDSARRASLLLDTALAIQEALESAWNGAGLAAAQELEAFLIYFDQMALGLSDRTDPTSRGLSEERDLIEALIGNLQSTSYYFYEGPIYALRAAPGVKHELGIRVQLEDGER